MLKIKTVIVCLIPLLFISASCEKEDQEPEFKQGFSCKINGEEWIAKTPASVGGPIAIDVEYIEAINEININATRKDTDSEYFEDIYIYIKNVQSEGAYNMETIGGLGNEIVCFYDFKEASECGTFYHDSLAPGKLKICEFDKTKRAITGTFEMNLIAYKCNDEVMNITDGKFSFRY